MAMTVANVLVGTAALSFNPNPGDAVGVGVWTELGYTEDGVIMTYTADTADVEVEEETFPIKRVLVKETIEVTCNLAESTRVNLNQAMAGATLAAPTITLGAGAIKELNIKIIGTNLGDGAGTTRTIHIPYCTATGATNQSYKKGEKVLTPVTFQGYSGTGVTVCTITDA